MVQTTLDAFLSSVAPSSRDPPAANSSFLAEQRPSNSVRCLAQRDSGLCTSAAARRSLQLQACFRHQQVACMLPGSAAGPYSLSAVTGLAVNQATGGVAWVQAQGLLHLSTMADIQQAAATCRQRAAEAATNKQQGRDGEDSGSGSEGWQCCFREQQAWLAASQGSILLAPPCKVGTQLQGVAFDPGASCKLALCGAVGPSSSVTLLDLGKASPTYRRLLTSRPPTGRMEAVKYLPPSHSYSLASSDRRSVFLWDLRRGATNTCELHAPQRLVSALEPLPGTSLVCAVTELQQLLVWDLRQGSGSSSVQLLGAAGPFQHALLCCRDLGASLAAAHSRLCAQAGAPLGRPSGVQQVAAHPRDPSVLALQTTNLCTAVYRLAGDCITHMAMAPDMFHAHTAAGMPRKLHSSQGAWDAAGSAWWSCATAMRPPGQGARDQGAEPVSDHTLPSHFWAGHNQPGMPGEECGGALGPGAGRLYYKAGVSMQYEDDMQHVLPLPELELRAFAAARDVEGLGDAADALQGAGGAGPGELLAHPAALQGGGSPALWGAVRRWEDRRRRVYGPRVTPMSSWPTCFASYQLGDDVLVGTEEGCIAVLSPGMFPQEPEYSY